MGYEFHLVGGHVKLEQEKELFRELLNHAGHLELAVLPLSMVLSGHVITASAGAIPDLNELENAIHQGRVVLDPIDETHMRGLIILHPYVPWHICWNASGDGSLFTLNPVANMRFLRPPSPPPTPEPQPIRLIKTIDAFFSSPQVEAEALCEKHPLKLHCPWRKSDVKAACELLAILANHCDDLQVHDDYGVWPACDFSRWVNLAERWSEVWKKFGAEPIHPDMEQDPTK